MALLYDTDAKVKGNVIDLDEDNNAFDDGDDGDEDIIEFPARSLRSNVLPGINACIICRQKPPYSSKGKNYTTCGLRCAAVLEELKNSTPPLNPRQSPKSPNGSGARRDGRQHKILIAPSSTGAGLARVAHNTPIGKPATTRRANPPLCVVCLVGRCRDDRYVTCGIACTEKLCKSGPAKPNLCNYCHRRPKNAGHDQCGATCMKLASLACLLCKSRPKFKGFHLCGRVCKMIATKSTPLLLEAPVGHATYEFVKNKFKNSWKSGGTPPTVKNVFKIIEGKNFLQPYDRYKKNVGNEVFRYHGTSRKCTLGSGGNTQLCANAACALCSILKTSFQTSFANPGGAFGAGIYSSSASNLSYAFTAGGVGAIILTKVLLGNIHSVGSVGVKGCPPGFNSVVYDSNGSSNQTIVYADDAIRPVFLITF